MADYTTLKAAIASVIKTNGNQEITGLLLQQTLHSMLDGINTTKQDTINFVINTANKFLRDDGTFQEIQSPAGGFANNLYFTDIDSVVVSGYKTLSYNPDAGTINLNASVTSAEGVKTVQNYLYPSGVSVDLFPSGLWSFNFYAYLDLNVGNTQIGVQYFKRSVAGVETNLFTAWSAEINNTTPLWIKFEATNPSFIVDPTDRMGARILVKTTSTPAVNVTIAISDGYAAYLNNPNRIRHSQLRDWNGDTNYLHITQAEKTNFQTAYTDRFKWDGGSSGLNAITGRESLGLRIGIDVLAYRTFGSAANNNTGDFLAYNGVAVDSSKLGGQLPSYYQTNITAGTSLQYYRGDKTMQTLDTSIVPENSNMYFTYPRVLATALTGYSAGANTALSATDTILAAMGKIQGQINARALASDLSGHINNTTIHLTADEKTYLGKIMTYLKVAVDNSSLYSTINFYSESGVSAYGIGTGGGGGAGVDIIDDLLSVRADAALSANQGRILKGFVDLKQPQLNGIGFVKANGTSISYDNNSYALASHLHDDRYYTETEIANFFSGSVAISGYNKSNWDTAYGWGNHASAGYALASALHNAVSIGTANGLSLSTQVLSLSLASTSVAGSMSATDKSKLDGIAANANNYSLPTATASVLGGVKIGTNVDIASGVISVHNPVTLGTANGLSLSTQALSLALATTSTNGAMSSTQFNKLAGIADNANNYVHPTTSGNKHIPSGGASGNILKWSADGTAVWGAEYSYSLPLAASGIRGGIQIGYTASGANLPLLLSSEQAYISLTKGAIESVLTGAITSHTHSYEAPITAGTTLQYWRGDKSWQTLNTLAVPELTNLYFTEARVRASVLTGFVANNAAILATDSVLVGFNKAQGQINARALSTDLTAHINNTSPHLSADERTYFNKLKLYLKIADDNTSMYSTLNFYSESGVSAFGIGSGGGGSVGVDIIDDLLSVRTDAALSANQGRILKGFVDLKQPQLNGTGLVRMSGTSVSYDNTSYATSASLLSHTGNTSNPHSVTAAQVGALALGGGILTGVLENKYYLARHSFGFPNGDGDVHIGSSGQAGIPNGSPDYGFYVGYNAYRHTDGFWYHSRTTTVSAFVFKGGYHNGGFSWEFANNNGTSPITFTRLMHLNSSGVLSLGANTVWHSGNILNIGTTASSARTALGLGTMATETASNYLTTATAASTYLPLSGGYMTLNGVISKKAYVGGAWSRGMIRFENSTASIIAALGAFGESDSISYMHLGFNAYDANNLRVYSDKVQFGNSLIYHSGNSNSSSVAWAASTFTEGGVSLASKYLGISAKAADSDKLDGNDSTYFATATNLSNHTSATNNPHSVTAAQVGALALGGGTLTGITHYNFLYARSVFGRTASDGDVHIGSSGNGAPANGTQDYGFYVAYNAYRHTDGLWYHSRPTTVDTYIFKGGYHNYGFSWEFANNNGTSPITFTRLMHLTAGGVLTLGANTVWHSGNSNLTTIDWSAKNLTLAGSITGVTTITTSGAVEIIKSDDNMLRLQRTGIRTWRQGISAAGSFQITDITAGLDRVTIDNSGNTIFSSTIQATTAKLTNLTDGYIPYHISDASGLGNSPIFTSGGLVGIGVSPVTMNNNNGSGNFVIGNGSGSLGMTIFSGAANSGRITFADSETGAGSYQGQISYNHSTNRLQFRNNNVSALEISETGGVITYSTLDVAGITSITNTTQSTAYNNGALVLSGGLGIAKDLYSNGKGVFASYLESASYLKGTSVKIGANWEAIPNGNDLELRYGGVMKAKLSSSGDILAVGGVTAFAV